MNVSLTPELERMVNDKVQSGLYQTASEVIREGLRLLRERDAHLENLRADLQAGFSAVDLGSYYDLDSRSLASLSRQVKARGRKRLVQKSV